MDTLENRLQKRMHISLYALLFLATLLGSSVLLESCTDSCDVENKYTYYEPVYTTLDEIRTSIDQIAPEPLKTVGKIYYKDGYLFVNEPGKGIHIINNNDPAHPQVKSFLTIPGNYDLAIKGNTLYADSYIDVVALDISDINNIKEVSRLKDVFHNYNSLGFYADADRGLVTEWKERTDVKVYKTDCEVMIQPWNGFYYNDGIALMDGAALNMSAAIAPGNGSGPGAGGSMARFTISNDHLYILNAGNVHPVDITAEANPVIKEKIFIGWDIETIFPHEKNLFIGSSSGMHILDISAPASPVKVSTYSHIRSCDPVVVNDHYAYVTLRSGTTCTGFTNQLEVIDIKDLQSPRLLKTYAMYNPHGLGIDNTTLFICDGNEGLKVYDAADINAIDQNRLAHYDNIHAYDVIPFNNVLMMIGEDGIFQYDYSNPKAIKLLSHIKVVHEN